jgi:hypothetical protein
VNRLKRGIYFMILKGYPYVYLIVWVVYSAEHGRWFALRCATFCGNIFKTAAAAQLTTVGRQHNIKKNMHNVLLTPFLFVNDLYLFRDNLPTAFKTKIRLFLSQNINYPTTVFRFN